MHIDEVKALAMRAHGDVAVREALFAAMERRRSAGNTDALIDAGETPAREPYLAAWALTHLPPSDNAHIAAHCAELVDFAITVEDTSLRRLALVLLERLEWTEDEVRADLLDFCLQHFMDPREADGVRSLCIKLAYAQCRHYEELRGELRQSLLLLDPALLKPSVKHVRNKILNLL